MNLNQEHVWMCPALTKGILLGFIGRVLQAGHLPLTLFPLIRMMTLTLYFINFLVMTHALEERLFDVVHHRA